MFTFVKFSKQGSTMCVLTLYQIKSIDWRDLTRPLCVQCLATAECQLPRRVDGRSEPRNH